MSRIIRVLHIDDDPDTRLLLRELIQEGQALEDPVRIEWLEAASPDDAEERWKDARVEAIFVDHRLGGRDGVDLIDRLKRCWQARVWVLTGSSEPGLRERAMQNGANGLLAKDELLEDNLRFREAVLRVIEAVPSDQ